MHNFLFYSGQLPFASAIPNRAGGIVNTAGYEGAQIQKYHGRLGNRTSKGFLGATEARWIGQDFGVTDADGYFTEFDGTRSRVVHQFDRYGPALTSWLKQVGLLRDTMPSPIPSTPADAGYPASTTTTSSSSSSAA
jgi:hypothetical protein